MHQGSCQHDDVRRGKQTKRLTGAKGVVRPLELLAGGVVLALGGDALEVVRVVLEAVRGRGVDGGRGRG